MHIISVEDLADKFNRRTLRLLFAAFLFLGLFNSAHAQDSDDWDYSTPYKNKCSNGDMVTMDQCLGNEERSLDQKLNKTYQVLLGQLKDPSSLKRAESAWIKFRDLSCQYANSGLEPGHTLYAMGYTACLIDMTLKRIKDLETYLSWSCNGCPPKK